MGPVVSYLLKNPLKNTKWFFLIKGNIEIFVFLNSFRVLKQIVVVWGRICRRNPGKNGRGGSGLGFGV